MNTNGIETDAQLDHEMAAARQNAREAEARLNELDAHRRKLNSFRERFGEPTNSFMVVGRKPFFGQFVSYSEDCYVLGVFGTEDAAEAFLEIARPIPGYQFMVEGVESYA